MPSGEMISGRVIAEEDTGMEGVIRRIESSKYLTKCHKGLYLHVVPWVGHND